MPAAKANSTGLVTTELQPALDPSLLPAAIDTNVVLLPVDSAAEYEQTWRLNALEWKGFLSEASYLDREIYLMSAEITRNEAATAWILTCKNLPPSHDGSRAILAACETVPKTAYVAKGGKLEQCIAHGIGSVFCRKEYRGRKYADTMIKELAGRLATWQQPKGAKGKFSVLYSDIGKRFYAKHGWKAFPSDHIQLKPIDNAGEYHQRKAVLTPAPQLEDLTYQDLPALAMVDNLEAKLKRVSSKNPEKTFVTFRPDPYQLKWHFMREEFLAAVLDRELPQIKGAVDRVTGVAIIWARTYAAEAADWHLSVLYVHVPESVVHQVSDIRRSLSALLLRAQHEAKVWDMHAGVEFWDPSEDLVEAARAIAYGEEIKVISRDQEHICSLKWNGSENDDVVWLANERFAWC